jgi:hypothetical protein
MKRIVRNRRLTPEEAGKYKTVRDQVGQELPELVARHPVVSVFETRFSEIGTEVYESPEEFSGIPRSISRIF